MVDRMTARCGAWLDACAHSGEITELVQAEVDVAVDILRDAEEHAVFLCPYVSQCKLFLSRGTSRPVHTIDSFQGREAETVVLSMVRDGTTGSLGFWSDLRRVCVALTRARTRLVILASNVDAWPDHPMKALFMNPCC